MFACYEIMHVVWGIQACLCTVYEPISNITWVSSYIMKGLSVKLLSAGNKDAGAANSDFQSKGGKRRYMVIRFVCPCWSKYLILIFL